MLLEYLSREDSNELAELVEYCNFMLKELVQNSVFSSRMVVKPLANLNTSSSYNVFGPTRAGSRFDGIHLRGWYGSKIFTNDIIDAMRFTGMTRNWGKPSKTARTQRTGQQFHLSTSNMLYR